MPMRWNALHARLNPVAPLDAHLAALAAAGETITYGALAHRLGWRIGVLTAALEATMAVDAAAGKPLRAALCAGRMNDGMPAEGFFIKALELGLDVADRGGFVAAQRLALQRSPG
jgi:hypothetical protein